MSGLHLNLRHQRLGQDEGGRARWEVVATEAEYDFAATALLLCDVWNKHWSRGASERVDDMVPRMNEVVAAARACGVQIVHAPSSTMEFYAGTPARQRVLDAEPVAPPPDLEREDPPQPVDSSDGGSDTEAIDRQYHDPHRDGTAWTRQHPGIDIDDGADLVSDDGRQVFSCMHHRGVDNLLIMGVHTNMCVLNRGFAIKQMVRWGKNVVLVRDLTDAMYDPAMPPYVSHDEGTRLVIEYIEKSWCPTVLSGEILASCR